MKRLRGEEAPPAWAGYLVVGLFLLALGFAGWVEGMGP